MKLRLWLAGPLLLAAATAAAKQPERIHRVGLTAGTDVPVMMGGELELGPTRWFVPSIGVGFLPDGYTRLLTSFVDDALLERLIQQSLAESLALRVGLKSFPLQRWGLYASFTYTLYSLSGGANAREVVAEAGLDASRVPDETVTLDSTLHLLSFGLGYRFWLASRVSLSLEATYLMAVGSSSRTSLDSAAINAAVDDFLRESFRRYIRAPMLSAKVGVHLF